MQDVLESAACAAADMSAVLQSAAGEHAVVAEVAGKQDEQRGWVHGHCKDCSGDGYSGGGGGGMGDLGPAVQPSPLRARELGPESTPAAPGASQNPLICEGECEGCPPELNYVIIIIYYHRVNPFQMVFEEAHIPAYAARTLSCP